MASITPINHSEPPSEGAWIPYQVDFTTTTTGKHIALTKRIAKWRFGFMSPQILINNPRASGAECRGSEHEIKLIWSVAARKRSVLVDDTEIHFSVAPQRFPPPACPKFEHSFSIPQHIIPGYHEAHVTAYATVPIKHDPKFKQFDLVIDGLSYDDFPRIYQLGTAVMRDSYEAHGRRALTCNEAKIFPRSHYDTLDHAPIVDPPPRSLPSSVPRREENIGAGHNIDVLYDHDKPRSRNEEQHMVEFAKEKSLRELMKDEDEMVVGNATNAVDISRQPGENRRLSGSSSGGNKPPSNLDISIHNPFTSNAPTFSSSLPPSTRSDPQRTGQLFPHNSTTNANITTEFSAARSSNADSPRAANVDLLDSNLNVDYLDSIPTAQTQQPYAPVPLSLPARFNSAAPTTSYPSFNSMPPVQQTPPQTAPRSTSLYCSPPPPTWEETNNTNYMTPTWDSSRATYTAAVVTPPQCQQQPLQQQQPPQSSYQQHYK